MIDTGYLQYYLEQLGYPNMPKFLIKYLKTPSLLRLKKLDIFVGWTMDLKTFTILENI